MIYDNIVSPQSGYELIRIFTLEPGDFGDPLCGLLSVCSITDLPEYDALSYVWGTTVTEKAMTVNGQPLSITHNLDEALRYLRYKSERRVLWIDAVCINQQSVDERTHQVRLMSAVYSKATRVVVFVGVAAGGSSQLLKWINTDCEITEDEQPTLWLAITRFFHREWFSRIWVLQEVALAANDPLILCGDDSTSFCRLLSYIEDALSSTEGLALLSGQMPDFKHGILNELDGDELFRFDFPSEETFDSKVASLRFGLSFHKFILNGSFRVGKFQRLRDTDNAMSPLSLLPFSKLTGLTLGSHATDARDFIFGIYGLCGPKALKELGTFDLLPDYSKTVAEVFTRATALLITHALGFTYSAWTLHTRSRDELSGIPSWVPDLRYWQFFQHSGQESSQQRETYHGFPFASEGFDLLLDSAEKPLAHFSPDYTLLFVAGTRQGRIIDTHRFDTSAPEDKIKHLRDLAPFLRRNCLSVHKIINALVGSMGASSDTSLTEPSLELRNRQLECLSRNDIEDLGDDLISVWTDATLLGYIHKVLFTTDTGYLVVAAGGLHKGDLLAGLFIVDAPFVLRDRPEGGHEMISTAWSTEHKFRKEFPTVVDESADGYSKYGLETFCIH